MTHAIEKLLKFAQDKNLQITTDVIIDGGFHKYNAPQNQSKKNPSEWYIVNHALKPGEVFGSIGSFRDDSFFNFYSFNINELNDHEIIKLRAIEKESLDKYLKEKKISQDEAARKAQYLLSISTPASGDFPYLLKKKLSANGIRLLEQTDTHDACLLIPIVNVNGEVRSVQRIYADGTKRNLTGAETQGCFYVNGDLKHARFANICEGWADGETITLGNHHVSVTTFGTSNLLHVGGALKTLYPSCKFCLFADNDHLTADVVKEWKSFIKTETFVPTEKDFNDVYTKNGIDEVKRQIRPRKLPIMKIRDFMNMQLPPVEWKVEHMIQSGTISVIYGPPGVGKSFISLELGICLSEGKPFMSRSVPKRQRTFYLDYEMGTNLLQPRTHELYKMSRIDSGDDSGLLDIVPYDLIYNYGLNLSDESGQRYINDIMDDYDVFIFDNYLKLVETCDNDKQQHVWSRVFKWLQAHAKVHNKTFIFLHHSPKSNEGMRGSGEMKNDIDFSIRLEKPKTIGDCLSIICEFDKTRAIEPKYCKPFQVDMLETGWRIIPITKD